MKKENKLYLGFFIIGLLFLATGNPLMMGAGILCIMIYPLRKFTDYTSSIDKEK